MSIPARFALAARVVAALGLSLWLGGMAFFGAVAAPTLFRVARAQEVPELAPQIVGAMLTRFSLVTYVCATLMLVGWALDGLLSRDRRLSWRLQGVLSVAALALALGLGQIILPRTLAGQAQILPIFARAERGETLSPREQTLRAQFDSGHRAYQRLGSLNVWILLATLALLVARGTATPRDASSHLTTREPADEPILSARNISTPV